MSALDRYRPQPSWFAHNPDGIHGIAHESRVLVWVERLAPALRAQGRPVDLEVVRAAAIVHDVHRLDDGRDPQHGERAARWVLANRLLLPWPLSATQLEAVAYCCRWHVPPDASAPLMTPELSCLKDADALDRVRIYDLDPRRLRTETARDLVPQAHELWAASTPGAPGAPGAPTLPAGSWERVRHAALRLGLWP